MVCVRRIAVLCGLSLLSLATTVVRAQTSAEGSVRGYVKDEQGAVLPGVTVTASSPDAPGLHAAISDATGYYRLDLLPPATYAIAAELQGFSKWVRDTIVVRTGLNLGLEIVMKVGNVAETVEVKADTPLLESKTAVQAVNIDGEFQRALPLSVQKKWSDFMVLLPGVNSSTNIGGDPFYNVHGSHASAHVVLVDGAEVSAARQGIPTTYVEFSPAILEDVQVKTAAVDASAPLGHGAVISVATRSGSNELKGSVSAVFQAKRWNDRNQTGGTNADRALFQPDVAIGGPVHRDSWWLFGAYQHTNQTLGQSRTALVLDTLRALVPTYEPFDRESNANYYFLKTTAQLTPKHHASAFYQRDRNGFASSSPLRSVNSDLQVTGGAAYAGRLSSVWSGSWTTRVGASYNDKTIEQFAFGNEPSRPVHQRVFPSAGRLVGTGAVVLVGPNTRTLESPDHKMTLSADATYARSRWFGAHEFQSGIYLQWLRAATVQRYRNGGFTEEEVVLRDPANPAAGAVAFFRRIFDVDRVTTQLDDSTDYAAYVQDAWRPTSRLTVTAGLRVDVIDRTDKIFDLRVQDSTEIGPRLGVNYGLTADHQNIARASWVRVHDLLSGNTATAGTNVAGFRELYDVNLDGVFETTFVTPAATRVSPDRIIDLGRHQPHIDEWLVGYQRQLPRRTSLDLSFIRREFRNRTALVETNGIYDGEVFRGYRNEALNEIYRLTNNVWNWPVYSALMIDAATQTARVQMLASYVHQWRHIAGTWQPNDPASFIQPAAFPNNGNIGETRSPASTAIDANSLSGTSMASAGPWRDHFLRLGATWAAPWNLVLATVYVYQSGLPSGPVVTRIAAPDPRFGPATVTLSNGRVVSNPLATTIRFAFPTRGEGQWMLPAIHMFNLRAGRMFKFDSGRRLEMALDVINASNHDADQQPALTGGNQLYSPNYRTGFARQLPRGAQLTARFVF